MSSRHGDVQGACPSSRNRERYAEIGVEGTRACVALRALESGVVLSTEQVADYAVVTKEVFQEGLSS